VREDVGEREWKQDDVGTDERDCRLRQPSQVAAAESVVAASRRPERRRAEADEEEAAREGEQPGVVVPRRADLEAVVPGLADSGDDPE
jgi:hypothetical protein